MDDLWSRFAGLCRPGSLVSFPGGGLSNLFQSIVEASQTHYGRELSDVPRGLPEKLRSEALSLPQVGARIALDEKVLPPLLVSVLEKKDAFTLPQDRWPAKLPSTCHRYDSGPGFCRVCGMRVCFVLFRPAFFRGMVGMTFVQVCLRSESQGQISSALLWIVGDATLWSDRFQKLRGKLVTLLAVRWRSASIISD